MRIYITGTLKATGRGSFRKDSVFIPSDITLSNEDGTVSITFTAEESETSCGSASNRKERPFSCRIRGAAATIERNGRTETVKECSFMHIAELLIENDMHLADIDAYTDDAPAFETSVEQFAIREGNLLMDLSTCLNAGKFTQHFN